MQSQATMDSDMPNGSAMSRSADPAAVIHHAPMSPFQLRLLVVLFALYALDGFDVLSIAFAVPGIQQDWGVTPAALGVAISAGLLGTGVGSLFVAPFSDHWGRRPLILFCMGAMTLGMMACAFVPDIATLCVARFIAGVGIGGLLPAVSALAAEYSNLKHRSRSVSFVSVGFPVGGFAGGGIAALLLASFDWRSIFLFGGMATAVMMLVSWFTVPESIEFLCGKRPKGALDRLNYIYNRIGSPRLIELPDHKGQQLTQSLFDIFKPLLLLTTITITLTYAFHNATFYYSVNWLPKLAVDFGFTQSRAASIAGWCSAGGVLGAVAVAWLAGRIEITKLTIVTLCGSAASLILLAQAGSSGSFFVTMSILLGVCIYGGQVSLYALMMKSFPTHVRATGAGFVTGFGRLGGIMSPAISGYLFGYGMSNVDVSTAMAFGSVIGASAIIVGAYWTRSRLR
jgi:benzoate transport